MSFALSSLLLVLIYTAVGIGAGLVQRNVGLVSVAHAAIMGVGAYAYALATTAGAPVGVGFFSGLLAGVAAGASLTAIAARVRGESYVLVTFGIQVVWLGLVWNLDIVGGALGVAGIPGPSLERLTLVAAGLAAVGAAIYLGTEKTALAAAYAVVARGTELARALGLPVTPLLVLVGVPYGGLLGVSGAVLAAYLGFIDPSLFAVGTSVSVLAIGFFTLSRGPLGGCLGSLLIVGLPQALRLVGLSTGAAGYLQAAFSGLVLFVVTILWLQQARTK